MTHYNITVGQELIPELLTSQGGLAKLVESVLNQVLEAQATETLVAGRYERNEERAGYRNGYRTRQLYTRVGPVTLQVPQTRDGSFSMDIFKRYQRSEQAFVLALLEMVVNGVSTRKVTHITEELCGVSVSKSTVSQLCVSLDARICAFNERPRLDGVNYRFVIVDAMFIKSRDGDRVVSRAALSISGIREDGYREVLGLKIGDTESFATWENPALAERAGIKGRSLRDFRPACRSCGGHTQAFSGRDMATLSGAFNAQYTWPLFAALSQGSR